MDRNRRRFLAGLSAALLAPGAAAAAGTGRAAPLRVASLDYALAETLIALGLPPVALANAGGWARWVAEPALPPGLVDIGIDLNVNREVLAAARPDLILTTDYVAGEEERLARIAPVLRLSIYDGTAPALPKAVAVTRALGRALGREGRAEAFVADTQAHFAGLKARLSARAGPVRPLLVLSFMDARHVRVYGRPGLFQGVLDAVGLSNAWSAETNAWGFSTVGVEALAAVGEADVAILDPLPPDALPTLARSPLWRELPAVRRGRLAVLAPVLMFGALPAARRFASLVADAFGAEGRA